MLGFKKFFIEKIIKKEPKVFMGLRTHMPFLLNSLEEVSHDDHFQYYNIRWVRFRENYYFCDGSLAIHQDISKAIEDYHDIDLDDVYAETDAFGHIMIKSNDSKKFFQTMNLNEETTEEKISKLLISFSYEPDDTLSELQIWD